MDSKSAPFRKSSFGQRMSVSTSQIRKSSLSGEDSCSSKEPKVVGVMVKQKSETCLPPVVEAAKTPTASVKGSAIVGVEKADRTPSDFMLAALTQSLEQSQATHPPPATASEQQEVEDYPALQSPSPLHSPLVFDGDDQRVLQPGSYVGVNLIQEQLRVHAVKRGFTFNVMVVGRTGLGKTTLVNTLFRTNFVRRKQLDLFKAPPTVGLRKTSHVLEEQGVRVKINVVDTQGYGDYVNNTDCWIPLVDYIQSQNQLYLREEQKADRARHIPDNRIHCCLYFIPPTGCGLRPLDVHVLTQLQTLVNIIPVIAKADSLLPEEVADFKQSILHDLSDHNISYYTYPEADPTSPITNPTNLIPFAVVGSETTHTIKLADGTSRAVLGRKTPWGVVDIENPQHCEFSQLRDTLIRTCMYDLIDTTDYQFYEKYRREQLKQHASSIPTISESCV